ncbi:MAG: hypothetical protein WDO18_02035 [Acidobacteriota bacterium]
MKQILLIAVCGLAFGQTPQPKIVVKLDPVQAVAAKPGQTVHVTISAKVDAGFHVNADKQADQYLIPLRLTWTRGTLEKPSIAYSKAANAKLAFSEKPVNIFTGDFSIDTQFQVPKNAAVGATTVAGKLRYQACNDRECLIPRTIDIVVPVEIAK